MDRQQGNILGSVMSLSHQTKYQHDFYASKFPGLFLIRLHNR